MDIQAYLQVFAIAIWALSHLLLQAAPVLLPIVAGAAVLRSLMHRRAAY